MAFKYRKKPVVIEALQFTKDNFQEIESFIPINVLVHLEYHKYSEGQIGIMTLEGLMIANIGDYIIKGIKGEFYPCKPDIFNATYEKVEE